MNKKEQDTSSTTLEQERDLLLLQRGELLLSFVEAAQKKRPSKMGRVFQRLRQTNDFLNCLERIEKSKGEKKRNGVRQYAVSSLFLDECYKALTADRDEQFFFLTGTIVDGVNVLDQRLEFKHNKRSIVGVVGNHVDTHRLLVKLEQYGHRLLAHSTVIRAMVLRLQGHRARIPGFRSASRMQATRLSLPFSAVTVTSDFFDWTMTWK